MPELKIFWSKVLVDDFSHARDSLGKFGECTVVKHRKYLTEELAFNICDDRKGSVVCLGNTEILEL